MGPVEKHAPTTGQNKRVDVQKDLVITHTSFLHALVLPVNLS